MANFLDKAIALVAPGTALRRMDARDALARRSAPQVVRNDFQRELLHTVKSMMATRRFDGAAQDRMTKEWHPGNASHDLQFGMDGRVLRDRARDLVQNNGHGKAAMGAIVANVIGTGIKPLISEKDRGRKKAWKSAWDHWAKYEADVTGHQHFYELEALILKEQFAAGELLLQWFWFTPEQMRARGRRTPLALKLVESERIADDQTMFAAQYENGIRVRNGVENDPLTGEPLAYWILPHHPNDLWLGWIKPERHDAEMFRHVFIRERIGQNRGVTWMAAAIGWLYKLGAYTDNEMMASALAACMMLAIKTIDGSGDPSLNGPSDSDSTDDNGNRLDRFEPGMVARLAVGEDIEPVNPGRPNAQADPWITLMLRSIGASMDLGYEAISRDHSKTNFSGGRSEELENRRRYRQIQTFLKWRLLCPIWDQWVRANVLIGTEGFPTPEEFNADSDAYLDARWVGDGREWVDPAKEQAASEAAINANQRTLADECAETDGQDWEEVLEQRAYERERMKSLKLPMPEEMNGNVPPVDTTSPAQAA